jgi:hypothetical protein
MDYLTLPSRLHVGTASLGYTEQRQPSAPPVPRFYAKLLALCPFNPTPKKAVFWQQGNVCQMNALHTFIAGAAARG